MLDEETPARAAELAERILDEVSAANQDWRLVERWRDSGRNEPPGSVRRFLDAHRRLEEIAGEAGGNPDAIVHDLDRGEVRAYWFEHEVCVVVDQIGPAAQLSVLRKP